MLLKIFENLCSFSYTDRFECDVNYKMTVQKDLYHGLQTCSFHWQMRRKLTK